MHIVYLSPEVWPFVHVGGLSEVAHDLPLVLGAAGHTVEVITPKCRMSPEMEAGLELLDYSLEVPVSWRHHRAQVYRCSLAPNVRIYFVTHEHLFDREGLYGNAYGDYEDNAERFIFYSRAALELVRALGRKVDVVHGNDWSTGLVPLYLKSLFAADPLLNGAGTVMTIHNLATQGIFWHYDMPLTGLGWEFFTPEGVEFYGKINFLKAGLVYADMLSTVSRTYAEEIMTEEQGCGLHGVLQARQDRLVVIPNGIDLEAWDPLKDPALAANFSHRDLAPRARCSQELRREMGLPGDGRRPLAIVLGRLLDRRGLDILAPSLEPILDMGLDLAVMGRGEDHYHVFLEKLKQKRPDQLALFIGWDDAQVHRMVAGADMMIMPSRFEPCGLHQMHAMRYGTVPVVRATGGLDDTVSDHTPEQPGTGFKFKAYEPAALMEAVARALDVWRVQPHWQQVMRRGMTKDFSWQRVLPAYLELYQHARSMGGSRGQGA